MCPTTYTKYIFNISQNCWRCHPIEECPTILNSTSIGFCLCPLSVLCTHACRGDALTSIPSVRHRRRIRVRCHRRRFSFLAQPELFASRCRRSRGSRRNVQQVTFLAQQRVLHADAVDEVVAVLVRRPVDGRRRFDAVIAAKFTDLQMSETVSLSLIDIIV